MKNTEKKNIVSNADSIQSFKLIKGPWSKEEDEKLIVLVNKYGPRNWPNIAKGVGTRIGKQCRERWCNHLRMGLKRTQFTPEEDKTIIRLHRKLGNRWSQIAKSLPGRSDNTIKNYWNSALKKKMRNMSCSTESIPCSIESEDRCFSLKDFVEGDPSPWGDRMNASESRICEDEINRDWNYRFNSSLEERSSSYRMLTVENAYYESCVAEPFETNPVDTEKMNQMASAKMKENMFSMLEQFKGKSEKEKIAAVALIQLYNEG